MGRKKLVTTGLELGSGLVKQEEVMGSLMEMIEGLPESFRQKISPGIKGFVSRQAHLGGILEYTAQSAVVDPQHTLVYDWNQTTVQESVKKSNAAQLMPFILNPEIYTKPGGPRIKEIIILKSRFSLAQVNSDPIRSENILAGRPETWGQLHKQAKGPDSIEPDVIVLKYINGQWYIYIVELKIGAGQADPGKPKEHFQLMRGKRLFMYYQRYLGLNLVKPENIKLYFTSWMHGTPKNTPVFKRWDGAPSGSDNMWSCKLLQGSKDYAKVIGVDGDFIDSILKKLELARTSILSSITKKFTSKTGRYHENWKKMAQNLTKKIKNNPRLLEAVSTLPPRLPHPNVESKNYSNKATGFVEKTRNEALFGQRNKDPTKYTSALLTRKIRNSRKKAMVYYSAFKNRYKERLARAGQRTNISEANFIKALLNPSPITGTTPVASAMNMMHANNLARNIDQITKATFAAWKGKPAKFLEAKAKFNAFSRNVFNSNHGKRPGLIKNYMTAQKAYINSLKVHVPAPKARAPPKPRPMSENMQTATLLVKSFAQTMGVNMTNAQAQKVIKSKTVGGVNKITRSLVGASPPIKNENLASAIRTAMAGTKRKASPGAPTRASGRPRTAVNYSLFAGNNSPAPTAKRRRGTGTPASASVRRTVGGNNNIGNN